MIKRSVTIRSALICMAILSCSSQDQPLADAKMAPALIKADFRQITRAIEKETPDPFYLTSRAAYDSLKSKIEAGLNEPMSPVMFYQKLSPLIVLLKDEHFQLFMGDEVVKKLEADNPSLYFPFTVLVEKDRIYTDLNFSSDHKIERGTEILKINNIPAKTILEKIRKHASLPANEENFFERRLEDHFYRSLLMDLGFRNNFAITFSNKSAQLKGVSRETVRKNDPDTEDFSHKILTDKHKTGYLQLNTLINTKTQKLDTALSEFFKQMADQQVKRLVIDIRNNLGGSTKLARTVFDYITTKKYRFDLEETYFQDGKLVKMPDTAWSLPKNVKYKFDGTIVLLTNVKSYSSAYMMAVGFKDAGIGTVIGQVSTEPMFISGEVSELITTHTKTLFYHPTSNFYLPGYSAQKISYFIPDIEIYPTTLDRIKGNDKALEAAIKLLN